MWTPSEAPLPDPAAPPTRPRRTGRVVAVVVAAALVFAVLVVAGAVALTFVLMRPTREAASLERAKDEAKRADIPYGLLVTQIVGGSAAERVGLRVGDVVVGYGGAPVYDRRTYEAALNAASDAHPAVATLGIARGTETVSLPAPTGKIGFVYQPWTLFKDRVTAELRGEHPETGAAMLDDGERRNLLSPTQLLVVKIQAIRDGASPEDTARREDLVRRLVAALDPQEYGDVAFDEFDHFGSLEAASTLYELALERDPSDVNTRLNLGNSLSLVGRFDEAERVVRVEYDRPRPNLSLHGYHVAESVLGTVDQGRGRFAPAAEHLRKAIELEPTPDAWDLQLLYMHAAGRSGGLEAFEKAKEYCRGVSGATFDKWQCHADAIEAELLDEAGRRDDARRLVARWRPDAHACSNVERYWAQPYVAGADVLAAWRALTAE